MSAPFRLVVAGAAGRMGQAIVSLLQDRSDVVLHAALEGPGHAALGAMAGGVTITDDALAAILHADGLIDFTAPASTVALARLAAQARIVHVIGTTGFRPEDEAAIAAAARHAAIIKSGNFSLGVAVLSTLVRRAAQLLGPDWDLEIVEMHHRAKADAPSGTALLLGQAAAQGRGVSLAGARLAPHDGHTGPRTEGGIGFAALRGGSVVGDHDVILAGPMERLVLGHRAESRAIFARGALFACLWGKGRKPGLYGMDDVLGTSLAPGGQDERVLP